MSKPAARDGGFRSYLLSVDTFWFARGSATSLGVTRILIGFFTLVSLLMVATGFRDWFGENSYVPIAAADKYIDPLPRDFTMLGLEKIIPMHPSLPVAPPRINLLSSVSDPKIIAIFYALVVIFAILTTIGLWTKMSSILLAIGVVSLHHRNGLLLNGADTVNRIMVLYLALSPCGRACSVDRLWKLWKGKETADAPKVSLWSQKLIQYNMALLYFTTFWLKFGQGAYWRNLTATYYSGHLNEFHRFWVPDFINRPPFIYVTSLVTLAAEISLATLVFYKPARKWVLLSGLLLHGFIEYSMNIPMFGYFVCSMYVSFYSGEEIAGFFKRLGSRFKDKAISVALPVGLQLKPASANFLSAVDPLGLVSYVPSEEATFQPKEVGKSWRRSLGAWPLAWVPGVWPRILRSSTEPRPVEDIGESATSKKGKRARV